MVTCHQDSSLPAVFGFLVPRNGLPCLTHQPRVLSAFSPWCVILGETLNTPEPPFPHLRNADKAMDEAATIQDCSDGRAESEH